LGVVAKLDQQFGKDVIETMTPSIGKWNGLGGKLEV
jgi:hypothetical protein